jgi:hypothetical protein
LDEYCRQKAQNTGNWLLDSDELEKWRNGSQRVALLHGISGSGKTVLWCVNSNVQVNRYIDFLCSASIIDQLIRTVSHESSDSVCYFFFKSPRDNVSSCLGAFLNQFCNTSNETLRAMRYEALRNKLSGSYLQSQDPSVQNLMPTILSLMTEGGHNKPGAQHDPNGKTFIVLDALDICEDKEELFSILGSLCKVKNVHLLLSCRDGPLYDRLTVFLKELHDKYQLEFSEVGIEASVVDKDISEYIRQRFKKDLQSLDDYPDWRDRIHEKIKPSGM